MIIQARTWTENKTLNILEKYSSKLSFLYSSTTVTIHSCSKKLNTRFINPGNLLATANRPTANNPEYFSRIGLLIPRTNHHNTAVGIRGIVYTSISFNDITSKPRHSR